AIPAPVPTGRVSIGPRSATTPSPGRTSARTARLTGPINAENSRLGVPAPAAPTVFTTNKTRTLAARNAVTQSGILRSAESSDHTVARATSIPTTHVQRTRYG